MRAANIHTESGDQNLRSVLTNTSLCMRGIVNMIGALENELIQSRQEREPSPMRSRKLQSVDLAMQSIDEIVLLLERISQSIPDDLGVDWDRIIAPIRLKSIRDQVSHDPKRNLNESVYVVKPDVELF